MLNAFNPLRHCMTAFDLFVNSRYNPENRESFLWLQGFLALAKTANVMAVESRDVIEYMRSMVQNLTCVLSNQAALDFVYKIGQVHQPVPIARPEKQRLPIVTSACNDDENVDDDELPSSTTMNAMRATCLRALGCNVDWKMVKLERLPDDWVAAHVVELDELSADDSWGESTQRCSLARTLIRLFCLHR